MAILLQGALIIFYGVGMGILFDSIYAGIGAVALMFLLLIWAEAWVRGRS